MCEARPAGMRATLWCDGSRLVTRGKTVRKPSANRHRFEASEADAAGDAVARHLRARYETVTPHDMTGQFASLLSRLDETDDNQTPN